MKNLFLAVCAVFAFATVNAQDISFGAKAGVNLASVNGDDVDDLDGRTGFHIGAVAHIGISEKFAVQPELIYSTQGATEDDLTVKLDYLNLPILADYTVAQGFSLQAGPQIGFNVTDSVEFDGEEIGEVDAEGIDFSLAFGAQYKMNSGLFFQARYALGLTDISSDGDAKNGNFQFSVGYFFL